MPWKGVHSQKQPAGNSSRIAAVGTNNSDDESTSDSQCAQVGSPARGNGPSGSRRTSRRAHPNYSPLYKSRKSRAHKYSTNTPITWGYSVSAAATGSASGSATTGSAHHYVSNNSSHHLLASPSSASSTAAPQAQSGGSTGSSPGSLGGAPLHLQHHPSPSLGRTGGFGQASSLYNPAVPSSRPLPAVVSSSFPSSPEALNMAHTRLKKEGVKLGKLPVTLEADGVFIDREQFCNLQPGEASYDVVGFIQGPITTPWERGVFEVVLTAPSDYPLRPFKARFAHPIFHPNVGPDGRICEAILEEMWSPTFSCETVLQTMRSLLSDPKENLSFEDGNDGSGRDPGADKRGRGDQTFLTAKQIQDMNPTDPSTGLPRKLYHYTRADTAKKIKSAMILNASASGAYGPGIYATACHPGHATKEQVLMNNYGGSRQGFADFVVELDVAKLIAANFNAARKAIAPRDIWLILKNGTGAASGAGASTSTSSTSRSFQPVVFNAGGSGKRKGNGNAGATALPLTPDNCVVAPFHMFASCEQNYDAAELYRSNREEYSRRVRDSVYRYGRERPDLKRQRGFTIPTGGEEDLEVVLESPGAAQGALAASWATRGVQALVSALGGRLAGGKSLKAFPEKFTAKEDFLDQYLIAPRSAAGQLPGDGKNSDAASRKNGPRYGQFAPGASYSRAKTNEGDVWDCFLEPALLPGARPDWCDLLALEVLQLDPSARPQAIAVETVAELQQGASGSCCRFSDSVFYVLEHLHRFERMGSTVRKVLLAGKTLESLGGGEWKEDLNTATPAETSSSAQDPTGQASAATDSQGGKGVGGKASPRIHKESEFKARPLFETAAPTSSRGGYGYGGVSSYFGANYASHSAASPWRSQSLSYGIGLDAVWKQTSGSISLPQELEGEGGPIEHEIGDRVSEPSTTAGGDGDGTGSATCAICHCDMEKGEDLFRLKGCGHGFHRECLLRWFEEKRSCPMCNCACGVVTGQQPRKGTMAWSLTRGASLPGEEGSSTGTIFVTFSFPSGHDQSSGQRYAARTETGLLPDNYWGLVLLELFKVAFRRRVMFGFGTRMTGGQLGPTFNVHLKTRDHGGQQHHGYPDDTYFERCLATLKDSKIGMKDLPTRSSRRLLVVVSGQQNQMDSLAVLGAEQGSTTFSAKSPKRPSNTRSSGMPGAKKTKKSNKEVPSSSSSAANQQSASAPLVLASAVPAPVLPGASSSSAGGSSSSGAGLSSSSSSSRPLAGILSVAAPLPAPAFGGAQPHQSQPVMQPPPSSLFAQSVRVTGVRLVGIDDSFVDESTAVSLAAQQHGRASVKLPAFPCLDKISPGNANFVTAEVDFGFLRLRRRVVLQAAYEALLAGATFAASGAVLVRGELEVALAQEDDIGGQILLSGDPQGRNTNFGVGPGQSGIVLLFEFA